MNPIVIFAIFAVAVLGFILTICWRVKCKADSADPEDDEDSVDPENMKNLK